MQQRGSLENPNLSLTDAGAWDDVFGSNKSSSGERVTPRKALGISEVWRGVNLIAGTLAKVPVLIYQQTDDDNQIRDKKHPAYRLLRRKASRNLNAFEFKRTMQHAAIMRGNSYAYIDRRNDGSIIPASEDGGLLWLDPAQTYPVVERGRVWYVTTINLEHGPEQRKLDGDDVFHIRGLSYDGLYGYPICELASEDMGSAIAKQKFGGSFFKNAATPKVVLQAPKTLSDGAYKRLKESWETMGKGLENAHKTAILEEGTTAFQLSFNSKDSQLIESRQLDTVSLANWLQVPVHKLGGDRASSYNSLTEENQSFLDDTMDVWFCVWENEIWDKLLSEKEKELETHFAEFLRQALVRNDLAKRGSFYRTAVGAPYMARSEARKLENLAPTGNPDDDKILTPLNMTTGAVDKDGDKQRSTNHTPSPEPHTPSPSAESHTDAVEQLIRDTATRMAKRLLIAANRGQSIDDDKHTSVVRAAFAPIETLAGVEPGEITDVVMSSVRAISERQQNATDTELSRYADTVAKQVVFVFTDQSETE